jgi:hypothetical protein
VNVRKLSGPPVVGSATAAADSAAVAAPGPTTSCFDDRSAAREPVDSHDVDDATRAASVFHLVNINAESRGDAST